MGQDLETRQYRISMLCALRNVSVYSRSCGARWELLQLGLATLGTALALYYLMVCLSLLVVQKILLSTLVLVAVCTCLNVILTPWKDSLSHEFHVTCTLPSSTDLDILRKKLCNGRWYHLKLGLTTLGKIYLLVYLSLLLLQAGDVERNPGPRTPVLNSDLPKLVRLPIAANWWTLGFQLGLPINQLDIIQTNCAQFPDSSMRCLTKMFDWWLNNIEDHTYESLVIALDAIGKQGLALKVCKENDLPILPKLTEVKESGLFDADRVKQEIAVLEQLFRTLVKETQKDLKAVDMDDLHFDILQISEPTQFSYSDLYKTDKRKLIATTKSPKEILVMLSGYWNFLDYDILKYIIDLHGCTKTKLLLDEFLLKLQSFLRCTKVELFIKVWPFQVDSVPEPQSSSMQVKLSKQACTLEEVEQKRRSIYAKYPLSKFMLQISGIEIGSIIVTWLIPPDIVHKLQVSILLSLLPTRTGLHTIALSKTAEQFKHLGIFSIAIAGVHVFDEDPITGEEKHMTSRPLALTDAEVEKATAAPGMEDPADLTFHLRNLTEALQGITTDEQLKVLGFYLGFTLQDLISIQEKTYSIGELRNLLLILWLEDLSACWKKLVVSLRKIPAVMLAEQIILKYPILQSSEKIEQSQFRQLSHQTLRQPVNVDEIGMIKFDQTEISEEEIRERSGVLLSELGKMIEKSEARLRASADELRKEAQKGEDYWKQEIQSQRELLEQISQQSSQLTGDLSVRLQKAREIAEHYSQLIKLELELHCQKHDLDTHQSNMQAKIDYNSELTARIGRLEKLRSYSAVCLQSLQTEYNNFQEMLDKCQLTTKESITICRNAKMKCEQTMEVVRSQLNMLRQYLNNAEPKIRTYADRKEQELQRWEFILKTLVAVGSTAAIVGAFAAMPFTLGLSLAAIGLGAGAAVAVFAYMDYYSKHSQTTIHTCRETAYHYKSRSGEIDEVLPTLEVHS